MSDLQVRQAIWARGDYDDTDGVRCSDDLTYSRPTWL